MRNVFLAVVCCALSTLARSAGTPEALYAELPLLESPLLSPDGMRYACQVSVGGKSVFEIVSISPEGGRPLTLGLADDQELLGWHWVNDDWLLLRIATTLKAEGETFRVTRAFGVSARDLKIVQIARNRAGQNGADLLWIARDGSPRVLLAIQQSIYLNEETFYPEVFEVDVSTGNMVSRARPQTGVMDWYADAQGNVRMGIGYSDTSRKARLLYRDRNGETFRVIDKASGRSGESLTIPALFLAEPGKALVYDDQDGYNALYELDLATLQTGRKVFGVPGYDIGGHISDPTGGGLLGVNYTDNRLRHQWFDPVVAKAQRDLEKAAGAGKSVHIISMSRNQRQLIAHAGSASDPGMYYYVDLDKRSMSLISAQRPGLAGVPQGPVRSLRYKARDGLEIEAVLTLPPGREPRSLPLVVLPHGGPEARDDESWDWWAQYLAQRGYAVVQPNYRGSTGYGTAFEKKGDGQWGMAMQDDLIDAIDHLASLGIADPRRVCIAGASYGGYAALRAAQRDGARYRCAVSYAGVADVPGMQKYDGGFLNGATRRASWKDTGDNLKQISPLYGAEQFSIPVLLMHGKQDLRVPVAQSRQMAERLRKAGKEVKYLEQPEADHYFSRTADRLQFLTELDAFLAKYNPATAVQ